VKTGIISLFLKIPVYNAFSITFQKTNAKGLSVADRPEIGLLHHPFSGADEGPLKSTFLSGFKRLFSGNN
jgi:hypothetical protein